MIGRFFRAAAGGVGALLAVDAVAMFTGVSLGINAFTLLCGGVLGVPGIITLLILNVVFG